MANNDGKSLVAAQLGYTRLGESVLPCNEQAERQSYSQVHGFTADGEARFRAFLAEYGSSQYVSTEACISSCLGAIEDNLNSVIAIPLDWELSAMHAIDGKPHTYCAELDDFIIETVASDSD